MQKFVRVRKAAKGCRADGGPDQSVGGARRETYDAFDVAPHGGRVADEQQKLAPKLECFDIRAVVLERASDERERVVGSIAQQGDRASRRQRTGVVWRDGQGPSCATFSRVADAWCALLPSFPRPHS